MMTYLIAAALVVASPSLASVRLDDGRTAWVLSDGAEVSFRASGEVVGLEARFHRGRDVCWNEEARIDVFQDGMLVAQITDEAMDGSANWALPVAYQGFPVMASLPHGFHLQPGAHTVTLRVVGAQCGVSITSSPE